MSQKVYMQLFVLMFLPLVACQLPSVQTGQPTAAPTALTTIPSDAESTLPSTPEPIEQASVAFETVAINESGANIDATSTKVETQLLLLTSAEEVALIQAQINPESLRKLQTVNFEEYVVIALLRGRKPSNNYQTVIERIEQQEQQLIVHAQFWEPNPQWESTTEETWPYHLVKVARELTPDWGRMKLALQSVPITPTPPAN